MESNVETIMGALEVLVSRKRSAQENDDAASVAKPAVYFSFTSFLSTVVLWSVRCFHLGSMDGNEPAHGSVC